MKQIKNKYIPIQKSGESSGIEFGVTLKCASIYVQYTDIMRFLVRHNRHHKVSQSVPLFMSRKAVTIF